LLRPLRAVLAAAAISTSAAVCEELAFRGVIQTGLARVLALTALPASRVTIIALVVQALIFGRLHAYTPSIAYLATASAVGLAFGYAFVSSGNLFVPIVMHFTIDLISFMCCHVSVARSGTEAQIALLTHSSPIASSLRRVFYGEPGVAAAQVEAPGQRELQTGSECA